LVSASETGRHIFSKNNTIVFFPMVSFLFGVILHILYFSDYNA